MIIRLRAALTNSYSRAMTLTGERREALRAVLREKRCRSQEELLRTLLARGIRTTQPVLSRDLRALRAVKRDGLYTLLESERITPLENLASLLRGTAPAGANMVVVYAEPGAASAIARALEAERIPGLLGTVAGDDTIFVAVENTDAGERVRHRVIALL